MISISITSDLKKLKRALDDVQKQARFATAKALTDTAKHIQSKQPEVLDKSLDNPTPFTKRGFYIKGATKANLVARVGIKDIQANYLKYQIKGGARKAPNKALLAPVQQRRNKYGNIPKGRIQKLLQKPNVFSGVINGTPGIWERNKRGGLKLLVSYATTHEYKRKPYDFEGTARVMANRQLPISMKKAMQQALRTAR